MLKNVFYSLAIAILIFSFAFSSDKAFAEEDTDYIFDASLTIENKNLEEMRGTALSPEILGLAIFNGVSTNNISSGTISGGNSINTGAFSGSSGLSTIIQNSGNNVVIQSATILNLSIN